DKLKPQLVSAGANDSDSTRSSIFDGGNNKNAAWLQGTDGLYKLGADNSLTRWQQFAAGGLPPYLAALPLAEPGFPRPRKPTSAGFTRLTGIPRCVNEHR